MIKWRGIPGWEGLYEVSSDGRVRSLDRVVQRRGKGDLPVKGKELKRRENGDGYNTAVLCSGNGVRSEHTIANLMARAFLGLKDGQEADHKDRDSSNDVLGNIRVVTRAQNMMNRSKFSSNTSGFKGVSKDRGRWLAKIQANGESIRVGSYRTKGAAAKAYAKAAKHVHGQYASLQ